LEIEILGSGGGITTPVPGCKCKVCIEVGLTHIDSPKIRAIQGSPTSQTRGR